MGVFDKFKTAEVMGVRQYIDPGKHRFLIRRANMSASTNPQKANTDKCVVELKVVRSDTMKPDMSCSLVEVSTSQGYYGNVLAFVAGVLGLTIDEMKLDPDFDNTFEMVFGVQQIFVDMLIDCVAQQVKTTSATAKSEMYTAKTWYAVPATEYAQHGLIAPAGAFTAEEPAAA